MAVPTTKTRDQIIFMVNNISPPNLDSTVKEFLEVVNEEYYAWFAHYLINERAIMEPNFHDLYLNFIDKIKSRSLEREILNATYKTCKVLLSSERIKEQCSRLKSLGSWLGKLTIGRNQVLRAREIDPISLIIEAYERGFMFAVMPFIVKLMEPCKTSLVYRPPNPWTMEVLALLAEVYALPDLKLNLKFGIELTFKNVGVDLKEVKPIGLLKNKQRQLQGNSDYSNKEKIVSHQPVAAVSHDHQPGKDLISFLKSAPMEMKIAPSLQTSAISAPNEKMVLPAPSLQISAISAQNEKMVLPTPPFQISTLNEIVMPMPPVQFAYYSSIPYGYEPEFPFYMYPPNFTHRI